MLLPRRLGRPGVARGEAREQEPLGIGHDLRLAAPATQLVQEAEVRDLQDPRAHGAPLGLEPSGVCARPPERPPARGDRKSTRLNSSHITISYAVFCLKKKSKR